MTVAKKVLVGTAAAGTAWLAARTAAYYGVAKLVDVLAALQDGERMKAEPADLSVVIDLTAADAPNVAAAR